MHITIGRLLLHICFAIALNIFASYLILPHFVPGKGRTKHYNVNDIYIAIYIGLLMSAIEIIVVWIALFIFMD